MRLRPTSRGALARALAVPVLLGVVATAAAPGVLHVRVHAGDTLWGLARSHHTSVATLRRLNHIRVGSDLIIAGQLLAVPGNGSAVRPGSRATAHRTVHYVVRSGDNVTVIARRTRTTVRSIVARNHLSASGLIVPGQRLTIVLPARAASSAAGRPVPGRAEVRRLIAATARHYGVDPALALGLSYMESGFNQRVVSRVGAIGVMQVLPSTGRWLSSDVLHEPLDLRDTADNVRAGVVLLRLLTRAAPLRTAVAGYYQGLASVRAHGMYADTRTYVADVLSLRQRFARR
ncbi:MAG: LysM peptidoglycan-binding domain-containing protein [Frankiaceae bacterium]